MKVYEITRYENGVKKSSFVEAENREKAAGIAWNLGYEDIYISEVESNDKR